MSILYASIIKIKANQKIAESKNYTTYKIQIKTMMPEILSGINIDRFELIDNFLSYIKSNGVIFLCISDKRFGGEKPSIFLQSMIGKVVGLYGTINAMVDKNNTDLYLNNEINIDAIISDYITGIEESIKQVHDLNKDVLNIKQEVKNNIKVVYNNVNKLEEALLNSDNIKLNADDFKKKTKKLEEQSRPCCTPFIKFTSYTFLALLLLFAIYAIASLIKCDSLDLFCDSS
jgi:hypothetical protein